MPTFARLSGRAPLSCRLLPFHHECSLVMFGALGPVATLRDALIRPSVDHQRHPDLFGCALLITAVPLFAFSWLSERHIDAGHRQERETDRWTVTSGRGRLVPTAGRPSTPWRRPSG
ncbi:hypothetical protein L0E83_07125 [Marichromatium gracile]|uniref:hypothetical protein n=1 Tax=Marichromatium gracile TaxID=1048 RepID=UPI001F20C795|nr:hypothetical protein [Marichromatium gracile]MCF1183208.1 hypothetical protein [Marichromatium gracile]